MVLRATRRRSLAPARTPRFHCIGFLLCSSTASAFVIQGVEGPNGTEITHASVAGGAHIYLVGTNLGSAFAAPSVFIGSAGKCDVQPFTSTRNRLHCIINSVGLPPPTLEYSPHPSIVEMPLRVYKGTRFAECWMDYGINKDCHLRFDITGTPRVTRVLTREVEPGGLMRIEGHDLFGGLQGTPMVFLTLYRGKMPAVGVCGEKSCQASNSGTQVIGCNSRVGSPDEEKMVPASAYTDHSSFGCTIEDRGGLAQITGYWSLAVSRVGSPEPVNRSWVSPHRRNSTGYGLFFWHIYHDKASGIKHYGENEKLLSGNILRCHKGNHLIWPECYHHVSKFSCKQQCEYLGSKCVGFLSASSFGRPGVCTLITQGYTIRGVPLHKITEDIVHKAGGDWITEDDIYHDMANHRPKPSIWWKDTISPARGNAHMGLLQTPMLDCARGESFDAEIVPRITHIVPTLGSLVGGTDLTIYGSGFGYAVEDLVVRVGETAAACVVSRISEVAVFCRVQPLGDWAADISGSAPWVGTPALPLAGASLASHVSERGVRYAPPGGSAVLFNDFFVSAQATLQAGAQPNSVAMLEGWFESPFNGSVTFLLNHGSHAKLYWSGGAHDIVKAGEMLATTSGLGYGWPLLPTAHDLWNTAPGKVPVQQAIARPVSVRAGHRYWLSLECEGARSYSDCGLGVRMHLGPDAMPVEASVPRRRLAQRTETSSCTTHASDRTQCCGSYDKEHQPCIPSTYLTYDHLNGRPAWQSEQEYYYFGCRPAKWVAFFVTDVGAVGACPANVNPLRAESPIEPRRKLGLHVGCETITDRIACGMAIDGRLTGRYRNQPCMPAATYFADGLVCRPAITASDFGHHQLMASLDELKLDPTTSLPPMPSYGNDRIHQEVQRITMQQHSPERMAQIAVFTAIECPEGEDCIRDRGGWVRLRYNGRTSDAISIDTQDPRRMASDVELAFLPLANANYSTLRATVTRITMQQVEWRLEIVTPLQACLHQRELPLLEFVRDAKVNASIWVDRFASCLEGALELSLPPTVFTTARFFGMSDEERAQRMAAELRATGGHGQPSWAQPLPVNMTKTDLVLLPWHASAPVAKQIIERLLLDDTQVRDVPPCVYLHLPPPPPFLSVYLHLPPSSPFLELCVTLS